MRLGDGLDDGQAEARARGGARPVGTGEPVKRPLGELRGDARALVADVQLHGAVHRDGDELDASGAVTQCVVHEIPESLLQPSRSTAQDEAVRDGDVEPALVPPSEALGNSLK